MSKQRKTWRWVIIAIILVAALAGFFLLRQSRSGTTGYAEELVRSGGIETYYSFSGNIAVRDNQEINAKANATIREIYVEEDQTVAKGTPLMRLSNGDIIKADIDGEITNLHVSVDDTVSVGAPLAEIVNFDNLQVRLKVDEFDVAAVTVGKDARVTIEALGLTYDAVVEYISKQPMTTESAMGMTGASSSDLNYYEAKLTAPKDEQILPGMKVDVKILNESVQDALLLPVSALQFDAYNKPFVYIRGSSGDVVQLSVSAGIQDGATVQILDGLRSGDTVLVPQTRSMFPMMDPMR